MNKCRNARCENGKVQTIEGLETCTVCKGRGYESNEQESALSPSNNIDEVRKLLTRVKSVVIAAESEFGPMPRLIADIDALLKPNLEEAPSNSSAETSFWDKMDDLQKSAATNLVWNIYKEKSGGEELHWNICKAMAEAVLSTEFPYHGYVASTSLKEEQRDLANREQAVYDAALANDDVAFSKAVENLAMRVCPECKVCGGTGRMTVNQFRFGTQGSGAEFVDCPTCKGTGEVPLDAKQVAQILDPSLALKACGNDGSQHQPENVCSRLPTPPASTSLGDEELDALYRKTAYSGNLQSRLSGLGFDKADHLRALQAVASAVSLRYKGEMDRLESENLRLSVTDLMPKAEQIANAALARDWRRIDAENKRLTTLCNENAVLAVEGKAENARKDARKDAVIEEAKTACECALPLVHPAGLARRRITEFLDRLAQKGKS